MIGITTKLSVELSRIEHLTEADIRQLRIIITDFFASAFAGYEQNCSFNQKVESVVLSQEGKEESLVFMQPFRYPARIAAFINAVYCHGAELDDGNKNAAGHPGVHIIPAVFALADKLGSRDLDVLRAIATGYEAFIRISSAAQPGLVQRSYHSTGVVGTLGCAAACARLFHLDAEGIEDAIALATTMTGGLLSYGDSTPAIKPLNPGKAAENGLFAAMLAKEGIQGPIESLEGRNGWFNAVTDEVNEKYLNASNKLLIHECYFKLYPSCRHTHCGIDAAINLSQKVKTEEIEKVDIYIYPNAIKLAGIKNPRNRDETKFSIYYTFACSFVNGRYGLSDMDPFDKNKDIYDLMEKICLIPDNAMEDRTKGIRGARVEILTKDGRVIEETVPVPKGDPENPITEKEILTKLSLCSKNFIDDITLSNLIDGINQIGNRNIFINPMTVINREK